MANGPKFPRGNPLIYDSFRRNFHPVLWQRQDLNIYEINFLRRVRVTTPESFKFVYSEYNKNVEKNYNEVLKRYSEVLKNPESSENEIILCYNELIVSFLYLINYRSKYTALQQIFARLPRMMELSKMEGSEITEDDVVKTYASSIINRNDGAAADSILKAAIKTLEVIFSRDNKTPILYLTDKLKYWGLNQSQADFLTDRNVAPSNIKDMRSYLIEFLFKGYKNNDTLAPNEPLGKPFNTGMPANSVSNSGMPANSASGGKRSTRRKKTNRRKKSTRGRRRN